MRRIAKYALVWLLLSAVVTGCWDIKHAQDINYLTTLGFDHVDNQYVVYVQMVDFTTIAKMESGKPTQPVPVWVGSAKGETAIIAFNELYKTAQMHTFYGQVNTVVLSERVMKKGIEDVNEFLQRYYEMRFTPWIFGTKQPIEKLFTITPFFNLSPMMSVLHQPLESFKQQSRISPATVREFISNYREPGRASLIPSLTITNEHWQSDGSPHSVLAIDGVFAFQNEKYKGWLGEQSIPALPWLEPKTNRNPLVVRSDGAVQATLSLEQPRHKIIPQTDGGKVSYALEVELSGNISEQTRHLPEKTLQQMAEDQLREEIDKTFREGLRIHADLLQLEHTLYRKNNRVWKNLREQDALQLTPESLHDVKVTVHLRHSGRLKY